MKNRTISIILHIGAWLLLLGLPLSLSGRLRMGNGFFLIYYSLLVINGLIFYINYLLLVPEFFFRKKKYKYYLSVLILISCFYFISDISGRQISRQITGERKEWNEMSPDMARRPPLLPSRLGRILTGSPQVMSYLTLSSFMIFLSLGLKVLERQSEIEKKQEEIEKAKLNAELALLKNQISPHFFFNTLNNIYSLIGRSTDDSKNAVVKLARMMRYVLNESGQDNKHLSDEIEFMRNYIDLMRLRIGDKTRLNVIFPDEYDDIMIPHLLFISLIENAFKYGVSVQEESYINIGLECGETYVLFTCVNSLPESVTDTGSGSPGTGLENLRKRLALLYPGRHELEINKATSTFEVRLLIHLQS